ncbi:MAG: hypothetical protein LH660_09215 [Phormidesmis sp. CAN_BIN36]|nr:hypothetical protein [Phormidesmis sp. CAN_BIN36]
MNTCIQKTIEPETLGAFWNVWESSQNFDRIRGDIAQAIAKVTSLGKWEKAAMALLTQHYRNLKDTQPESALVVKVAIDSIH